MEVEIYKRGYFRTVIQCCEADLLDIRAIMAEASDDLLAPVERRAVATRILTLMDKQRDMPK